MKINFKTFLVVFLVALLGGALGAYGINELNKTQNISPSIETVDKQNKEEESITSVVNYAKNESGIYSTVIDNAIKTVVEITTKAEVTSSDFFGRPMTSDATYLGSGVIISSDGYIVTNNHVVKDGFDISVVLNSGESYEAEIIGTDAKTDLALLKINATNLPFSKLVDSDQLMLGQEVIAIGNALGQGISCSNGIISAINREVTISNYAMTLIQTNAAVNNGNSGGGLFDMSANLVGIVNAKSASQLGSASVEGIGYAIPSNIVNEIIMQLKDNGYVKDRPTLGVKIYTSEYNSYYNIEGLVVSEVIKGGAADKAGIKENDIIKAIDGDVVKEFSELSKKLDDYKIGDTVTLTVDRNGKLLELKVALQESPSTDNSSSK